MPTPTSVELAYEEACEKFGKDKVMLTDSESLPVDPNKFSCVLEDSSCYSSVLSSKTGYWSNIDVIVPRMLNIEYWKLVIHFPVVTVSNESNERIEIYDLFACVGFTLSGRVASISYCRTTYTQDQLNAGYCHSHTPRIYDFNSVSTLLHVCLGLGPINNTIHRLNRLDTIDRVSLKIFFIQLDTIVHSESLAGGPYIRLAYVGRLWKALEVAPQSPHLGLDKAEKEALDTCLESYLHSNRLKLGFSDGQFKLACPFDEWLIDLSDYIHKWLNTVPEEMKTHFPYNRLFKYYYVSNNTIVVKNSTNGNRNMSSYVGREILKFNGVPYSFQIKAAPYEVEVKKMTLLGASLGSFLLQQILKIVNYYYEQEPKEEFKDRQQLLTAANAGNCTPGKNASDTAYFS